jgi:hypothetical protein
VGGPQPAGEYISNGGKAKEDGKGWMLVNTTLDARAVYNKACRGDREGVIARL